MLEFFYQLWKGYELIGLLISGIGLLVSIKGLHKDNNKPISLLKKSLIFILLGLCGLIFLAATISGTIRIIYTKTPNIVGKSLLEARDSLENNELELDESTKQKIQANIDILDYIVIRQEPTDGTILRRNETVSVDIQAKNPTDSKDIEQDEKGLEQSPRENQGASAPTSAPNISKPTIPTPNTSTSMAPVITPDSNNSTESSNDPSSSSSNNASIGGGTNINSDHDIGYSPDDTPNSSIGGGVNSDSGAGDFQPQDPRTSNNNSPQNPITVNGNPVSDIVDGVVSDIP